jgi:isopropylmalate/homocitrate/citramalate synthase
MKYFDIEKTYALLDAVKLDRDLVAAHFHNTYNRAIQNLVVALSVHKPSRFVTAAYRKVYR